MSDPRDTGVGEGEPGLLRHYEGDNATEYDIRRSGNAKWRFEEDALRRFVRRHAGAVTSVIDAPVGTGRFLPLYREEIAEAAVCGLDWSEDMLAIARSRVAGDRVILRRHDIVREPIVHAADLVVCYRFLNLIPWEEARRVLVHLFDATRRVLVLAIRLVDDSYTGGGYVEEKIYLHRRSDFEGLCREQEVAIVTVDRIDTQLPGDYCVVECAPRRVWRSGRLNKNRRAIYTYGRSIEQGKVYETKDAGHAAFVRAITGDLRLAQHFPRVVAVDDHVLDVEWCPGDLVPAATWQRPLELLVKVQSLPSALDSSFDYVEDIVIPRFSKALPVVGRSMYERVVCAIRDLVPADDVRISHPDVIPGNVVETADGALVLIDNELLCRSPHYRVDILNVLQNLPTDVRAAALATYLRLSGVEIGEWERHGAYLTHLWFARQVGSDLIAGQLARITDRLKAFGADENVLPYDPAALRSAFT